MTTRRFFTISMSWLLLLIPIGLAALSGYRVGLEVGRARERWSTEVIVDHVRALQCGTYAKLN